ncbi:hypothetical protein K474DRAFT_1529825 [Panus rudis PR-1116 ss-1]|nr:hypothetical protein K474DRAFT_1529825 [Panus rudis PR-1116 ss-1]
MPIPATLTSYLPALLKTTQVPDDLSYSTLPQGQVDYLSHEWREEDVWRSWRNMTRQKNAIANGMRLENASWRTWWKQRNKLKTVNPETLNWLKDSDVTWLYGPLHVGTDWQDYKAPKKPSPRKSSFSGTSKPSTPTGTKPILKRRSISQLLSLPASPLFDHDDTDTESEDEDGTERPKLLHTKSDTHISWRSRPHRKDSPPRIIAPELPQAHHDNTSTGSSASGTSDSSDSTGSEQDTTTTPSDAHQGDHPHPKKKHISFNTFVEQCIAIEKPKPKRKSFIADRNGLFHDAGYDDGYEEDSDVGYDYEEPSSFFLGEREQMGSDSDEDDDDVLEIRTSSSRSRSSSSSRSRHSPLSQANGPAYPSSMRTRPPLVRQSSTDRERMTIAPIPPTILKSTGVGNELADIPEDPKVSIPKEVELVYVPPSNSIYSLPSTPNIGAGSSTPGGPGGAEDVYHHRESYFSVGTSNNSRHTRSLSGGSVPSSSVLPHAVTSPVLPRTNSKTGLSQFFGHQPVTDEPMHIDSPPHAPAHENNESREGDAYDYFGGPGLGEDFPASDNRTRSYLGRRRRPSDSSDDNKDDELEERERERERQRVVRYSQGGAASVSTGRSSRFQIEGDDWSSSPRVPSVVVNEVAGAEEEREEESNSPLASRVPSSSNLNNADQQSSSSSTDTPSPQPSLVRTQSSSSLSSAGARPIAIKTTPVHESDGILAPYPISTSSNSGMSISFGTGPPLPSPIRQQNSSSSYQSDNYLSPTDSGPTRGRPPLLCPPGGPQSPSQTQVTTSHSGSSTTSYSYSTDSRSESRGRSSTRTSSFSSDLERERSGSGSGSCAREQERGRGRSGSRNGAGGGSSTSPIGSVSPSGSVIGIGSSYTGGAGSRGREREPMHHHSRGVSSRSSSYRSDDGRGVIGNVNEDEIGVGGGWRTR